MKLLMEDIKDTSIKKVGEFYYISGPFIQVGIVNGNNRRYSYPIAKPEVERYIKEKIDTSRALGELNHPPTPEINPKEASHLILSLTEQMIDVDKGMYNWNGKARILNTPNGKVAQALIEGGVQLAVSSRALGSLKEINGINEVQDDFKICTPADIVYEPSAPDAFVQAILENKEWVVSGQGQIREVLVDNIKKELKTKPLYTIKKNLLINFSKFLSNL